MRHLILFFCTALVGAVTLGRRYTGILSPVSNTPSQPQPSQFGSSTNPSGPAPSNLIYVAAVSPIAQFTGHTFSEYPAVKPYPSSQDITKAGFTVKPAGILGKSYLKAVDGKEYLVLGELGQGHFGVAYLGYAPDHTYVAIKLCKNKNDAAYCSKSEFAVQKSVNDVDAVVKVHDEINNGNVYGFVMDVATGGVLTNWITAPLAQAVAKTLFLQLVEGLVQLHKRDITIRDIKADNILVWQQGGVPTKAKFSDFGLAVQGKSKASFLCAQTNLAPEVNYSTTDYAPADVFAMGLVLADMLNSVKEPLGRPKSSTSPGMGLAVDFSSATWTSFEQKYPQPAKIVRAMVDTDPAKRPKAEAVVGLVKAWPV
jgi:serine/threonine protein kinase